MPSEAKINATSAVRLARANGWKITKTAVPEADRKHGKHDRWSHIAADTDTFDMPTHLIRMERGKAWIVMPVTPDRALFRNMPTQSIAEYDAAESYRYVRGNRRIGEMVTSESDGKQTLLSDVQILITSAIGKRAAAAAATIRRAVKPKRKPTVKPEAVKPEAAAS